MVQEGAWARIERNVFDHNRHALVGDGKAGTNYYAADNLVLKGGGYHQNYPGYTAYTHQFDVHGDRTCLPGDLNCGNAGDTFWYLRNAFQYTKTYAIKIRGRPRGLATLNNNAFAHQSVDAAVDGGGNGNIVLGHGAQANIAGVNSYGAYGVCDFSGDGRDDLLLATGATWWLKSAAKLHWVFLRAAAERLDALRFGNFDADPRCDVLRRNANTLEILSGGRGAWTALPGSYPYALTDYRFADFNADGRTDIFRRTPGNPGLWQVVSPGVFPWRTLNSSAEPLANLWFGDFDGDNVTDVVKRSSSVWSISRDGTSPWAPEPLNANLPVSGTDRVYIADVDNNGRDDIVRLVAATSGDGGQWQVSWDGRSAWTALASVASPATPPDEARQVAIVTPTSLIGRFDEAPGYDPLFIDKYRMSSLLNVATRTVAGHSPYPH